MSTPQRNTPKAPRQSSKQHRQRDPIQRSVVSENEAYSTGLPHGNNATSVEPKSKQRRKSQANKKGEAQSELAEQSDGQFQRSAIQPERAKATPIKQQAYAGPTFHQSPAPSALPLPSFYSRSVPSTGSIKTTAETVDRSPPKTGAPNGHVNLKTGTEAKRESTPLDFLFEAARKASTTPKASNAGTHLAYLSPPLGSPSSRSPGQRDGDGQFPFELGTPEITPCDDGSAFSTPYKERMDASRSTNNVSDEVNVMGEAERKAKSAALKKMLMTPQGSGQLGPAFSENNPFNARNMPVQQQRSNRPQSNPGTPMHMQNHYAGNSQTQYFPQTPLSPTYNNLTSPHQRPPSSNLRNVYGASFDNIPAELSSDIANDDPRISTARRISTAKPNYSTIYGTPQKQPTYNQSSPHKNAPSIQQMEDDLRRVLKLDLTSRG